MMPFATAIRSSAALSSTSKSSSSCTCNSIRAGRCAMASSMRIIARRMMSAAVPWIGALIAARRANPAVGPLALISGVWILRPNSVSTWPFSRANLTVSSI